MKRFQGETKVFRVLKELKDLKETGKVKSPLSFRVALSDSANVKKTFENSAPKGFFYCKMCFFNVFHHLPFLRPTNSLMPSQSKLSETRSVWSSGLLAVVAMT